MIIFKYGETKLDHGFYVVQVNQEKPTVAEWHDTFWDIPGIDWDIWQYSTAYKNAEIKILAKVDVNNLTIEEM